MKPGLFAYDSAVERPTSSLGRREHLTFRGNVKQGRHGWLRLTPAYSLHIVEQLLEHRSHRDIVLDPFSGTGTTPLASTLKGIPSHSVDINPFLVWLANLKIERFSPGITQTLRLETSRVISSLRRQRKPHDAWRPGIRNIEKWWDTGTLDALAQLFERISRTNCEKPVVDLLKVAFCRVMIQTAHVSFGHQSMSFKRPAGTVQLPLLNDLNEPKGIVCSTFRDAAEAVARSIETDAPSAEGTVFHGDSRDLARVLPRNDYTIVITSPPYPNRMSYIRELRPYMYWLGFLTNGRQAGELDWNAIGGTWGCATSLLGSWQPSSSNGLPYPRFDRIVASIGENHEILARYVHKYFEDIKQHISSLRGVLASGARCHYIVGNSKFYDTLVPVEEIYAALFEDAGFVAVTIETIRKRNSKKELFEYVVSAEAP